ncbi:hypothetical protein GCM10023085_54930 [Actinomadura viridis]|uniref:Uncharacterized protein n=1 Tax=Actinomadura viridis TaxID=58110 RepID=A0A931DCE2_9ACTN|nr:hypothetical protein [Actinomadura viridis]MBG6086452.1 hypothetical protein [Actinomadura viridis]
MVYPGDQDKPGGRPPEPRSQPPYRPEGDRLDEDPYGGAQGGQPPFAPQGDTFGGPAPSWDEDPADRTRPAPGPLSTGPLGAGPAFPAEDRGPRQGGEPGPFGEAPERDGPYGPPQGHEAYAPPPGGPYPPGGYDDDAYGGYDDEYGPGGPRSGPTPPEKRRNLPLIIGAAAVAGLVLIGGGIGLSSMLKDDGPKTNAGNTSAAPSRTATATPSPTKPVLEPVKLKSRTTDPSPLTLKEVFGKASFTSGGQKYVRTAWNAKRGCTGTVNGTRLTGVIKKGGCSQVLRATYARGDGKLVGTVGVLNLKTENAARLAQKAAAAKDAFLQPLPGTGHSRKIGKGEALGTAEARGHYLVMTWVQRPDGKKIASQYHKAVSAFGQQLMKGSGLNFALAYRETEGKPFRK